MSSVIRNSVDICLNREDFRPICMEMCVHGTLFDCLLNWCDNITTVFHLDNPFLWYQVCGGYQMRLFGFITCYQSNVSNCWWRFYGLVYSYSWFDLFDSKFHGHPSSSLGYQIWSSFCRCQLYVWQNHWLQSNFNCIQVHMRQAYKCTVWVLMCLKY